MKHINRITDEKYQVFQTPYSFRGCHLRERPADPCFHEKPEDQDQANNAGEDLICVRYCVN